MNEILNILNDAKLLAKRFRKLTGKPLGITGEVAEFSAANILGLKLSEARQTGYDATKNVNGKEIKVQIKGRCILNNAKSGQRLGSIQLDKEWDTVLMVLLDEELDVIGMYEAERPAVEEALLAPGSKARNERGALGVSKFKSISRLVWERTK